MIENHRFEHKNNVMLELKKRRKRKNPDRNPGGLGKKVGKKVGKSVEFDGGEGVYS